jgi:hypothetical protein
MCVWLLLTYAQRMARYSVSSSEKENSPPYLGDEKPKLMMSEVTDMPSERTR